MVILETNDLATVAPYQFCFGVKKLAAKQTCGRPLTIRICHETNRCPPMTQSIVTGSSA